MEEKKPLALGERAQWGLRPEAYSRATETN